MMGAAQSHIPASRSMGACPLSCCSPRARCRSAYATIAYRDVCKANRRGVRRNGLHARAASWNKSYSLSRLPRTIVTKVLTMVVDEPKLKARQIDERKADANMDFNSC